MHFVSDVPHLLCCVALKGVLTSHLQTDFFFFFFKKKKKACDLVLLASACLGLVQLPHNIQERREVVADFGVRIRVNVNNFSPEL